jgi:hypothetical protein
VVGWIEAESFSWGPTGSDDLVMRAKGLKKLLSLKEEGKAINDGQWTAYLSLLTEMLFTKGAGILCQKKN